MCMKRMPARKQTASLHIAFTHKELLLNLCVHGAS